VSDAVGSVAGLPLELSYETPDGRYSIRITRIEGPLYRVEEVGYADDEAGRQICALFVQLLECLERDERNPRLHLCADYTRYRGNSDAARKLLLREVLGRPSFGSVAFFGKGVITRVAANLLGVVVPGVEARAFRDEESAMAHVRAAAQRDRLRASAVVAPPNEDQSLVQLTFQRVRQWRARREAGFPKLVIPLRRSALVELARQQHEALTRHERAIGELLEIIAQISSDERYDASALKPPKKIEDRDAYWTIYAALHLLINDMAELLSERRRRADELKRARDVAEEANRARTEFLGTLSHELRTPLSTIVGLAPLLESGGLTPEQHRQLDGVQTAAHRMTRMMQDLLDFARIEAGALQLSPVPFDLHGSIEDVLGGFVRRAEKLGLALEWHCHDDLPRWVVGDRDRLQQVLTNLVDNAVKYTESGRVRVVVARGVGDSMDFTVSDTGRGIPDEHLENVFGRFERGVARGPGAGLGLAIGHQLVQLMGGELKLDSREGEGTTLRFSASLPEYSGQLNSANGRESVEDELEALRVLLAEDDPMSQYVTSTVLRKAGCQVVAVGDGEQAVEKFADGGFDLVLLDCQMPLLDGYLAARQMRRLESDDSHTPIIALTAFALERDRQLALEAGMDGHIAKPVAPDRLVEILLGHMGA